MLLPPLTIGELVGLLASGMVGQVLTMRYHLALLSAQQMLPTLAIGDDPKLCGLAALGVISPPVPEATLSADLLVHITAGEAVPVAGAAVLRRAMQ